MFIARVVPIGCLLLALMLTLSACDELPSSPSDPAPTFYVGAPAALSIALGTSTQIRAMTSQPGSPSRTVTTDGAWASSNPAVVAVDAWGIVTGVAVGTANVTVTIDTVTTTTVVTVVAASDAGRIFWGVGAGPNTRYGTLMILVAPDSRATGTVFFSNSAISLVGRIDSPTGVVNVAGGAVTFLGTVSGNLLVGTLTASTGERWAFSGIDATRQAVTAFCGAYVSNGLTSSGSTDAGAIALAMSVDGTVAGASLPSDASDSALTFTGARNGNTFTLSDNLGRMSGGSIQTSVASGGFQTADGSAATFSASPGVCP